MSETSSCWKCGYSNLQSASKFCSQCAANLSNPLSGSSGGTAKTGISFSVLPKKCAACKRYLVTSGVMDKNGRYYHQNCFTCCVCRKPVTTGYHEVMGEDGHEVFYCAKDYAATKAALCATCGKPLVGVGVHDQMTGEKRHVECFVCNICRKPIVGKYVMDADSRLSCSSCRPAAPPALPSPGASSNESCCAGCGGELKGKLVGVGKTKFHSHCFLCIVCKTDLTNVPFSLDDGRPQCKNCALAEKGQYCAGCGQLIHEGAMVRAMQKIWHEGCFKCGNCGAVICASRPYVVKNMAQICINCK